MKDRDGREYAKLSTLKAGDLIEIDGGMLCCISGVVTVQENEGRLYFNCGEGHHYLDGQLADDWHDDSLIGIYPMELAK